jgi:hypothetical protein
MSNKDIASDGSDHYRHYIKRSASHHHVSDLRHFDIGGDGHFGSNGSSRPNCHMSPGELNAAEQNSSQATAQVEPLVAV